MPVVQRVQKVYVPQNVYSSYPAVPQLQVVAPQYVSSYAVSAQREFVSVPRSQRIVQRDVNRVGVRRDRSVLRVTTN